MPVTPTYPGVYVEEIPSGVRTITGVATSITAFVGRTQRGPTDDPITINTYGDFERIFGGLWVHSKLSYSVRDFYLNGGGQAIIVRLYNETGHQAKSRTPITVDSLTLEAAYPGSWGENLRVTLDVDVSATAAVALGLNDDELLFNLTVSDATSGGHTEVFRNLTVSNPDRRVDHVLGAESKLIRWKNNKWPTELPEIKGLKKAIREKADLQKAQKALADKLRDNPDEDVNAEKKGVTDARKALDAALSQLADPISLAEHAIAAKKKVNPFADVNEEEAKLKAAKKEATTSDGKPLDSNNFIGPGNQVGKVGLFALEKADLFNILCIPPYLATSDDVDPADVDPAVVATAGSYCEVRRAILLIDPPSTWGDKDDAKNLIGAIATTSKNAAIFFPRLRQPDPLRNDRKGAFAPCGAVAGIFARTDTQRGIWKAPAGMDATLAGVPELTVPLTDAENGELNLLGINCLRSMPAVGRVVWGARTRQGDDRIASEWKYIPVRRTALFIEESLYRGLKWVVFEPNDEPLWAQIRLNVGAFMHNLFRQGAFQGTTPRDAYFVKCDKESTTQNDINLGIVNVVVGFAPLKPAEFVIIKLQQMAGQIDV